MENLEIYFLSTLVHITEIIVHCSVVPVSGNVLENRYLLPSMVPAPLEQNSVRFRDILCIKSVVISTLI